jgi:hypothetical protein
MFMRDLSEDYDDYRVVVDLEFSPGKVKAYKNKKGWTAVCELISPYHDSAIAAAGDAKHLIREAYVINDDFFSCVLAAPRPLQKRPIKTKEQVGDGAGGGAGV